MSGEGLGVIGVLWSFTLLCAGALGVWVGLKIGRAEREAGVVCRKCGYDDCLLSPDGTKARCLMCGEVQSV